MGAKTSLKIGTCFLSVLIASFPTHLLCQMEENPTRVEFLGTISNIRKRNKISSLFVYVLHKTRNQEFSRLQPAKKGKKKKKRKRVVRVQSCCFAYLRSTQLLLRSVGYFISSPSQTTGWRKIQPTESYHFIKTSQRRSSPKKPPHLTLDDKLQLFVQGSPNCLSKLHFNSIQFL